MSAVAGVAGATLSASGRGAAGAATLAALLSVLWAAGCQTGAERAGAQFLNRYFVEANQEEALAYTRGLAAERLRREIEDTRMARAVGGVTTDARKVYYELVRRTDVRADHIDLVYRLEVVADGSSYFRDVGLSMDLVEGSWLVSQFTEFSETSVDIPEPPFTGRPATATPATAATLSPATAATVSPATAATLSPATAATVSPATAATVSPATAATVSPATAALPLR